MTTPGRIAGYTVFLGEPTAVQTALALRQAICRKEDPAWRVCGLPATLYSDHGGDFTSDHIATVFADLKVQLIHSSPGKPRDRGKVERMFGTLTTELLPTLPGQIPPGNYGKPVNAPGLMLSQLDSAVGRYIVDTYHQRVHPETGQSPAARWAAGDWLPRMQESAEVLDLLLLTVTTPRKVQRDGIHCHGLRYFSITLAAYVGEPVIVQYDPRDLAEIRVYHHGFSCVGPCPRTSRLSPVSLKDLEAARNQRRRELRQHLTARRRLADLLTHLDPPASLVMPREAPAPRAGDRPRLKLYRDD
jgi:putative transposase